MLTLHKSSAPRPQKALCIILLLCLQSLTQAASLSTFDKEVGQSPTIAASATAYTPTHNPTARLWISSGQTIPHLRKRAAPSPASQPKSTRKTATASSASMPPPPNNNSQKSAAHAKHASDPAAIDSGGHPIKKDRAGGDAVPKKTSKKATTPVGDAASVPVSNTTDNGNKEFRDEEDPQADTKTILVAMCASLGGLACCFCCLLGLSRVAGCCYVRRFQNRRHHRDVLPVEHFVVCEPSSLDSKTIGTSPKPMYVSGPLDHEKRVDGAAAPRILSQFWNVPETKSNNKTASRGFFRNPRQVDNSAGPYITSPMDQGSVERPGVQLYSPSYGQVMPPSPCKSKRMPSRVPVVEAALTLDMPYDGCEVGTQHQVQQSHGTDRKQSRPDPIDTGHYADARRLSPSTTPYRSAAISPDEGYHSAHAMDRTWYR
ncbi:hypothetical protein BGZ67_003143 [Mortierella alpina]|nr:hypothetical protein BGZ67_003143 [Mortierella alpina]